MKETTDIFPGGADNPAHQAGPEADRDVTDQPTITDRMAESLVGLAVYTRDIVYMFFNFWVALYFLRGNRWKYTRKTIVNQILFTGVDALYVLGIIATMVGGVLMVRVLSYSPAFETDAFLMQILTTLIIAEIAPILTSLVLVGRSGSAITVELGEMRIKRHHEALESMGIDIYQYFHVPRVIGLAFSNIVLNAYFIMVTLASALLISSLREDFNWSSLLVLFVESLRLSDIIVCVVKGFTLGVIVALVCIYHGMMVRQSTTEIPQQMSQAVVNSFRFCFTINGLISVVWYLAV